MTEAFARELSTRTDVHIDYLEYDWSLNEQFRLSGDAAAGPARPFGGD